jgi:hypothetical protein
MTTAVPSTSTRPAIGAILAISVAATGFLFWLIYVHRVQHAIRFFARAQRIA